MRNRPPIRRFLPLLLLAGCGQPGDTMRVEETIPLPDSTYTTLTIDPDGVFWLGRPGVIARIASATETPWPIPTPISADGVPEPIGEHDGRVYFRTPETLVLVHEGGREASVATDPTDAAALDPLGRFVLTTSGAGTVVAYDASDLAPLWGWAAIGTRSHALAFSPEGDRVYQPAGPHDFGERPAILVRELQTGRTLRTVEMPGPVGALVSADDGSLYGALSEDAVHGSIFAMKWRAGDLGIAWTTDIEGLGIAPPLEIATSPSGTSIGVLGQNETGLHLLEVETGHSIDRLIGPIADFAFDSEGRLWVLYAGELRRVE